MKKVTKYFILILISVSTTSCPGDRYRSIFIKNNSSKSIYYKISFAYPDTTLKNSQPSDYKINPNEKTSTSAAVFAYNDTLQIFFLDGKLVETEPWDSILINNEILKRYKFTEQSIQKDNWTITYP
jgi:hypothetical protein